MIGLICLLIYFVLTRYIYKEYNSDRDIFKNKRIRFIVDLFGMILLSIIFAIQYLNNVENKIIIVNLSLLTLLYTAAVTDFKESSIVFINNIMCYFIILINMVFDLLNGSDVKYVCTILFTLYILLILLTSIKALGKGDISLIITIFYLMYINSMLIKEYILFTLFIISVTGIITGLIKYKKVKLKSYVALAPSLFIGAYILMIFAF